MRTNNLISLLGNISICQLLIILAISILFFILKKYDIFSALLISSLTSFLYTQLLLYSSSNKLFSLYGFPIRLLLVAPPCAILIHYLRPNLIALFIGFALSQLIYFIYIWMYVKKEVEN